MRLVHIREAAQQAGWEVRRLVVACGEGKVAGAVLRDDGIWLVPSTWIAAQQSGASIRGQATASPSVFVLLAVYFALVILAVVLWFAAPGGLVLLAVAMLVAGSLVLAGRLNWGGSATGVALAIGSVLFGTCGTCGMMWDSTEPPPRAPPAPGPSLFGPAMQEALAEHGRQATTPPLDAMELSAGEAYPNEAPLPELEEEAITRARQLNGDPNFAALLAEPSDDRSLLLSAVGESIARTDCFGQGPVPISDPARAQSPAMIYALSVMTVVAGTKRFPSSFVAPARDALLTAAGASTLWAPAAEGQDPRDWTSLAVLLFPLDVEIRRQHIAAKRSGPFRFTAEPDCATRPGLHRERLALLHLSRLTELTTTESDRLDRLQRVEGRRVRDEQRRRNDTIAMYQRTIPRLPGYATATIRGQDRGRSIEVTHASCGAGAIADLFAADFGVLNDVGVQRLRCTGQGRVETIRFDGE